MTKLVEMGFRKLHQKHDVRWHSIFDMLYSIIEAKQGIKSVLVAAGWVTAFA